METMQAMRQLPAYKSHKTVWALKIKAIDLANPPTVAELEKLLANEQAQPEEEIVGAMITPEEEGYAAFPVTRAYVLRHSPQVGGYWVKYSDNYESWSPAQAFEEGYTRI